MATTQVAVRLENTLIDELDWLIGRRDYENRAEAIRAAIARAIRVEREREIDERIIDGYTRIPPTEQEREWSAGRGFPGLSADDWGDWF